MDTTQIKGVSVSPVNMEDRRSVGIKAGDTVRVHQKVTDEKGKTRIQMFEGLVLARKHGDEPGATFTVRRVIDGIGVEKVFPLYAPMIDKIEIVRRSKVRRAKLYYIREKVARDIKRQMRRMKLMDLATESETEAAARAQKEAEEAEVQKEEAAEAATEEQGAPEQAQEASETDDESGTDSSTEEGGSPEDTQTEQSEGEESADGTEGTEEEQEKKA